MDRPSKADIATFLRTVPLFSECSGSQLRAIGKGGRALRRRAGTEIVKQDKGGVAFFVILDGTVEVSRDGRVVARLLPGDYFGELAMITDQRRSATATAATDVELFTFTQWTFRGLLLANPKIAYKVLQTVATRAGADTGIT